MSSNYLTGLGLDQPFIRTPSSGSARYYLSDALGSIVGLASTTGTVPTTYNYEPYGKTTVGGTGSDSFFGFTGRENDSTGTLSLYNYRARAYSPTLQRFLTVDPIGFSGGPDINLYAYVSGSPVSLTDPFGLGLSRFFVDHIDQIILALDEAALFFSGLGYVGFLLAGFEFTALVGASFLTATLASLVGGTLTAFFGSTEDKYVAWTTNALGFVAPALPGLAVLADIAQLIWDLGLSIEP